MIYFKNGESAFNLTGLLNLLYNSHYLGYAHKTYSDKELTILQCKEARRSFYDLLEIVQTYFPQTTKEELAYRLLHMTGWSCFYCDNIKKLVFVMDNDRFAARMGSKYDVDYVDSTGICFNDIKKWSENYISN